MNTDNINESLFNLTNKAEVVKCGVMDNCSQFEIGSAEFEFQFCSLHSLTSKNTWEKYTTICLFIPQH